MLVARCPRQARLLDVLGGRLRPVPQGGSAPHFSVREGQEAGIHDLRRQRIRRIQGARRRVRRTPEAHAPDPLARQGAREALRGPLDAHFVFGSPPTVVFSATTQASCQVTRRSSAPSSTSTCPSGTSAQRAAGAGRGCAPASPGLAQWRRRRLAWRSARRGVKRAVGKKPMRTCGIQGTSHRP